MSIVIFFINFNYNPKKNIIQYVKKNFTKFSTIIDRKKRLSKRRAPAQLVGSGHDKRVQEDAPLPLRQALQKVRNDLFQLRQLQLRPSLFLPQGGQIVGKDRFQIFHKNAPSIIPILLMTLVILFLTLFLLPPFFD